MYIFLLLYVYIKNKYKQVNSAGIDASKV